MKWCELFTFWNAIPSPFFCLSFGWDVDGRPCFFFFYLNVLPVLLLLVASLPSFLKPLTSYCGHEEGRSCVGTML